MPAQPLLEDIRKDPVPAIAIRIPVRLVGAVTLGLVAMVMVSLASWSVDDPSFSYATDKPAANWLGFPGAVLADLSFQIFGLGMLAVLVPPALWAWSFLRLRVPSKMGLRLITWVAASLLSCGVFAFVPVPGSWPLPTGLGGLIGAGFDNLAALATGENPQPVTGILFAIIIAAPTLALFWVAMGLGKVTMPKMPNGRKAPAGARRTADDDIEPERNSLLDVAIGALVHLGFSARSAFRRARAHLKEKHEAKADEWRGGAVEPSLHGRPAPSTGGRREPMLVVARRAIGASGANSAFDDTELEYTDDPLDDEVMYEAPAPASRPQASARVAAPAARPIPGSRAAREAQGSLLDDPFAFELPGLSLLAEPRHKGPSPEHAPQRLEAMARRLEGVLQDFGVKGDIINVRPGPVVTLYELEPAPGIKSSRVISLADDIARSMSAISARVAVVPGRNAIGIELPNEQRETVYLREMLASSDFEKMKGKLPICLGKTIGGEPI
ncbi:MAG: DNA translocase FtsK 4TM domain-containing protein, partial [Devosia sp.]|nr:DNA translocase FtsK 4TM domain-containing protein [Devosia sp.]